MNKTACDEQVSLKAIVDMVLCELWHWEPRLPTHGWPGGLWFEVLGEDEKPVVRLMIVDKERNPLAEASFPVAVKHFSTPKRIVKFLSDKIDVLAKKLRKEVGR